MCLVIQWHEAGVSSLYSLEKKLAVASPALRSKNSQNEVGEK